MGDFGRGPLEPSAVCNSFDDDCKELYTLMLRVGVANIQKKAPDPKRICDPIASDPAAPGGVAGGGIPILRKIPSITGSDAAIAASTCQGFLVLSRSLVKKISLYETMLSDWAFQQTLTASAPPSKMFLRVKA